MGKAGEAGEAVSLEIGDNTQMPYEELLKNLEILQERLNKLQHRLELATKLAEVVKKELAHEFYIQPLQQALRDFERSQECK